MQWPEATCTKSRSVPEPDWKDPQPELTRRHCAVMSITRQVPLVLVLGCGAGHHGSTGDGGGSNNNGDGGKPTACEGGLGEWTGKDDVPASQNPPCGLKADQVPQFVSIGFDDNGQVGGMT